MAQENLFNPSNFQSSGSVYQPDMTMQFAPSVPHRPSASAAAAASSSRRNSLYQSISNQDVLIQHQQFMHAYPPNSPYDRPESVTGSSSSSTHARQPQTKAERRAEHNAIERARRESLNVKFQQLAFTLPNLQNDTRPSKSTIIDRTLDFVKNAIQKEERYLRRINELEKFNSYLLSESDKRLQHKKSKKTHLSPSPVMSTFDASPVLEKASPMYSDKDFEHQEEDEDDEDDEDDDDDLEKVVQTTTPDYHPPMFKASDRPMQQVQFSPVTTPPTSNTTLHDDTIHSKNLPVSQSAVPMMPSTTNWPSCNTNVKEEHIMPYFQLQQQQLVIQKIIAPQQQQTEQQDFQFGPNPTMFAMMNNPFMNMSAQQPQPQHPHHHPHHHHHQQQQQQHQHHFMHRR